MRWRRYYDKFFVVSIRHVNLTHLDDVLYCRTIMPTSGAPKFGLGTDDLVQKDPSKKKPPPVTKHPTLMPKTKREERRVFLAPEFWAELTEVAEFHTEVFKAMEENETVSRNDIIEAFLRWAVDSYWEDKGGSPTGQGDRAKKVEAYAERLKAQRKQ